MYRAYIARRGVSLDRRSPRTPFADDADAPVEELSVEEGAHELVVRSVAQSLGLAPYARGVLRGIGWSLLREATAENLLRSPGIDGVRGHFDLEHAVRQILTDARLRKTAPPRRALERLELAPALEDGHHAGLRIEVRLGLAVLVLSRDVPDPAGSAVANHHDNEFG